MILERRIQNYVERFFLRASMTEWPTIRRIARGLNIGIQKVFDTVEGDDRCDTQGWNVEGPVDIADLEVYTSTPKIEEAWNRYWGVKNQESSSAETQTSQLATH